MNPYILWMDLETTGTDEITDEIIEVGAILTDTALNEIETYQQVYRTNVNISDLDPHVFDMHVNNGLWRDTIGADNLAIDSIQEIMGWLGNKNAFIDRLPLAGSGVGHFDRRFIDANWKPLSKRLQYWHYDIGVLRRMFRLFDIPGLKPPESTQAEVKTHRALDDIRLHLEEAKFYRQVLNERFHPRLPNQGSHEQS